MLICMCNFTEFGDQIMTTLSFINFWNSRAQWRLKDATHALPDADVGIPQRRDPGSVTGEKLTLRLRHFSAETN